MINDTQSEQPLQDVSYSLGQFYYFPHGRKLYCVKLASGYSTTKRFQKTKWLLW